MSIATNRKATFSITFQWGSIAQRQFVEVMKRNADRLLELTNDLLDAQRMESGKIQLRIEAVDIRSLTKECVQEVQPLLNQKGHHLHMEIPSGAL